MQVTALMEYFSHDRSLLGMQLAYMRHRHAVSVVMFSGFTNTSYDQVNGRHIVKGPYLAGGDGLALQHLGVGHRTLVVVTIVVTLIHCTE